jgi:predicted RNase H-like nuclease
LRIQSTSLLKNKFKKHLPSDIEKEILEMRECSFTPNLKKTEKLNRTFETEKSPRYEILYSDHQRKLKKFKDSEESKKLKELEECTFAPKINNSTLSKYKSKDHSNHKTLNHK